MNDEQLGKALGSFYKDTEETPPDPRSSADRVMVEVPDTPQVRRRWWLPPFRRKADTESVMASTEFQPTSIPATNGRSHHAHSPTVLGRTQSMFSPVKAITAGALVFAIGGAFLIAQPFSQQPAVPGAETEAIAPTWVTGTVSRAVSTLDGPACSGPDSVESDGDVRHDWIIECGPQTWTSSDPRLTAEVVRRWNEDVFQTDEGTISVSMGTAYLRNDGGGWACSDSSLLKGSGTFSEAVTETTFTCIGDGGYEDLSAILVSEMGPNFSEEFVGLIFSGDFPPLPEPPAAE
jgi:hypothetical protein